ncbi:DsbE family thiol:disulfide interchange protein [Legionella nagasakiensis]|uniref:DsbE family thiol:disulfide interchange protein n=1 Tax=Legionella nagasakiensis TaxID=535290 RepID=UPI001054CCDC|nr:DsbE family thiol:disulfide interchange protein [Legionella nagasakiensis]
MKLYWPLFPLLVFILLVCFFWRGLSLDPQDLPSAQIGKAVPYFQLPSLDGHHKPFTPESLQGKVVLLNVWASWCSACSEEQVFLLRLAREGVPLYGLNYKDNPKDAAQWLSEWGNPYKKIGSDLDGKVAINLGVYGAPETFLIDSGGVIRYRHAGPLNARVWEQEFLPRINALEAAA